MRGYIQQHRSEFLEEGQDVDAQSIAETASLVDANDARHGGVNGTNDAVDDTSKNDEGKGAPVVAVLRAVGDALSDLVGGLSPTSAGLAFVVIVLVLSNVWTLASRPNSKSASSRSNSRAPPMRASSDRTPDQVALAVRSVLQDYFADVAGEGGLGAGRGGAKAGEAATSAPVVVDRQTEVADIRAVLDGLEERIARLRGSLEEVE